MKEGDRVTKHPASISPSNKGEGFLFSSNPPFDPRKECPTEKDILLANASIQTPETKIADWVKEKNGAVSTPAALGIGLGGVVIGAGGAFLYEKVFAAENQISINSFPNSFNNEDNKIVDKRDIFDNTAKEGVITDRNTVQMTLEEYEKVAPPTVDPKTPERINIGLSLESPEGLNSNTKIVIKKRPDYIGGGIRSINPRTDPGTQKTLKDGEIQVNSDFIIEEGLEGKIFSLIIKDAKKVSIENGITENTQDIKRGGFYVNIETNNGDSAVFIIGTTAIQLAQPLPPAKSENLGEGQSRLVTTPVPIEGSGNITIVPLGKITTPKKTNFRSGASAQMAIMSFSTVTNANGIKQQGPVEIAINTSSEDKVILLK